MVLVLALAGACDGDGDGDGAGDGAAAPPTSPSTSATPTSTASVAPLAIDWSGRTISPATVGPWSVRFCEGEAPLICLDRDGRPAGAIERSEFPVSSIPSLQQALEAKVTARAALAVLAQQTVETFAADRKEGCGTDYLVTAEPVVAQPVLGGEGVRYGWSARVGGEVVERSVTYAAVREGVLHLLVAGGLAEGGCVEKLGEFGVQDLEAALPVLDRVAASPR